MSKLFGWMFAALAAVSFSAPAKAELIVGFDELQTGLIAEAAVTRGLNWNVGDKANYSIDMGFLKGTAEMSVRQDTGSHYWLDQNIDLMVMKQKAEVLINKSTGQIEKMLVNGQEQQIPKSDPEIVETKESHIKVPAGEFDCIYAKIREKSDGKISEAWINPQAVPITGMLKAIADSQLGKVTQELKSFSFAKP